MSLFDKINNSFVRITKDGSSQSINTATNGTTLVKSITIGNNSNRILIVSTGAYNLHPTVSGVTLGSQNFVKAISASHSSHAFKTELWYLINPTVGTADITVTWSSTAGRRGITGTSFYNVDQSSPIGVTNTVDSGGQSSTVSGTITPTTAGSMVIDAMMWLNGTQASLTRTAGAIQFINNNDRSTGQQYMLTPIIGSANTMNYTASDSAHWIWVGAEIKPVSTPHQPDQRVVEKFSGSVVDTDRWTTTGFGAGAGNTTFTIDNEVDGGALMLVSSGTSGEGMANFNNIRQFSNTGSVFICVTKSNDVASGQNSRVGLKHGTDVTFNGGQLAGTENGYNVTSISSFCADDSGLNRTNTSLGRDSSWHTFKGQLTSSDYKLAVDGVMETTDTTNLPTVRLQPFLYKAFNSGYTSSSSTRYYEAYNT